MADETTYAGEMNQAVHRPGMESVVNRGTSTDADGNRSGERAVASPGHADPFAVRGDGPVKGGAAPEKPTNSSEASMSTREGGADPLMDQADSQS